MTELEIIMADINAVYYGTGNRKYVTDAIARDIATVWHAAAYPVLQTYMETDEITSVVELRAEIGRIADRYAAIPGKWNATRDDAYKSLIVLDTYLWRIKSKSRKAVKGKVTVQPLALVA